MILSPSHSSLSPPVSSDRRLSSLRLFSIFLGHHPHSPTLPFLLLFFALHQFSTQRLTSSSHFCFCLSPLSSLTFSPCFFLLLPELFASPHFFPLSIFLLPSLPVALSPFQPHSYLVSSPFLSPLTLCSLPPRCGACCRLLLREVGRSGADRDGLLVSVNDTQAEVPLRSPLLGM